MRLRKWPPLLTYLLCPSGRRKTTLLVPIHLLFSNLPGVVNS